LSASNGNILLAFGETAGLAPLGYHGGPTKSHAAFASSPAVDAGNPAAVAGQNGVPLYDQRGAGYGRVTDGTGGGARLDIGAYERAPLPDAAATLEFAGTSGADTITVTDSSVTINGVPHNLDASLNAVIVVRGLAGNDTINASATTRAVRLYGDDGFDTLTGGLSADVLEGGAGNDYLQGGAGDDTYIYSGTTSLGSDYITETDGPAGSDTLDFSALDYEIGVSVFPTSKVAVNNGTQSLEVYQSYAFQIENYIGTAYNDSFQDNKVMPNLMFTGGEGNDIYVTDRLSGHVKIVELQGEGTDVLDFSAVAHLSQGINVDLSSNDASQTVIGDFTLDLSNAAGLENVIGTNKNDVITGNGNNNRLEGGQGDDTYRFAGNSDQGHDTIFELIGNGKDTVDFSGLDLSAGVTMDLRANSSAYEVINQDGDRVVLNLTTAELENVTGTRYADTLTGNSSANIIIGGAGNDWLQGREGADTLNGGSGNDTYSLFAGQTLANVVDTDGRLVIFADGTRSSRPFIEMTRQFEMLGRVEVSPWAAPTRIATISDDDTALANLSISITGLDSDDITIQPNGDVLWKPDAFEYLQQYQVTISVTDQQGLTNSIPFTAKVANADSDADGRFDYVETGTVGSDPFRPDTDNDQLPDGFEDASTVLNPLSTNDPNGDHDGDGLSNLGEFELGTNPDDPDTDDDGLNDLDGSDADGDGLNYLEEEAAATDPDKFDTDADLLSDGFEYYHALDPLDADENNNGVIDSKEDFDGDGASNLDEQIQGSHPISSDTDADGTDDEQEADQGSDPTDPDDLGDAPPADELISVEMNVGDDSGSHSERWELRVGDIRHQSPDFGVLSDWTPYKLRTGETYDVTLNHRGSNLSRPDYDWFADVRPAAGEDSLLIVENPTFTAADGDTLQLLGLTDSEQHEDSGYGVNNAAERTARIHIPGVDLDITNPAVSDHDEAEGGAVVRFNNDDDDGDLVLDYQDAVVASENDLLELKLRSLLPAELQGIDGLMVLSFATGSIRLWRDASRTLEITSNVTEFNLSQEHTVYVEGVADDGEEVEIEAIYRPDQSALSASGLTAHGTEAKDKVRVKVGTGNLVPYRPMHNIDLKANNFYGPFTKRFVKFNDRLSETLGPGIRINGDDDNNNGSPDFNDTTSPVANENDLIEVDIVVTPGQNNVALRRSSTNVRVWTTRDKAAEISFVNAGIQTNPLQLDNNRLTVFVEWASANHGNADISLVDSTTTTEFDKIKFHTFTSIIVAFGGRDADPEKDDSGTFQMGHQLYAQGYDVHMYDESIVDDMEQVPFKEIANALVSRGVGKVAIMGYSYGGGATYELSQQLYLDINDVLPPIFNLYTVYIDAIQHDSLGLAEYRIPWGTKYHINYYQTNGALDGAATEPHPNYAPNVIPKNTDVTAQLDATLTHGTIDNDDRVKGRIMDGSVVIPVHEGLLDLIAR
jgi:Ca2+-binding RTX toxin-like protein